jgi:hypothetical protein
LLGVGGGVVGAGGVGEGGVGAGGPAGQSRFHQHIFPPLPQLMLSFPTAVHFPLAAKPSAQIVAGRGLFFAHTYFATFGTNGVGEEVVGDGVGTGVGGFVGTGAGVGLGVGDGPESMHPLVVSKTAETGLEKLLLVSCSITQKNAETDRNSCEVIE